MTKSYLDIPSAIKGYAASFSGSIDTDALAIMTPDEIKSIRHRLGLTQRQLGEVIGYREKDASTIRRWETGARQITPIAALLLRYMEKYGLPKNSLST